jgi:hypothetical protein
MFSFYYAISSLYRKTFEIEVIDLKEVCISSFYMKSHF